MQIDPLVVALGAAICAIPVLLGLLIANWRQGWIEPAKPRNPSVTEMLAAQDPPDALNVLADEARDGSAFQ